MSKPRLSCLDAAKATGVLLVIFVHTSGRYSVGNWHAVTLLLISGWYMQAFFLWSGAVYTGKGDFGTFVRERACKLLPPVLLWGILVFLVNQEIKPGPMNDALQGKWADTLLITRNSFFSGYWFLGALFWAQLFCWPLVRMGVRGGGIPCMSDRFAGVALGPDREHRFAGFL